MKVNIISPVLASYTVFLVAIGKLGLMEVSKSIALNKGILGENLKLIITLF